MKRLKPKPGFLRLEIYIADYRGNKRGRTIVSRRPLVVDSGSSCVVVENLEALRELRSLCGHVGGGLGMITDGKLESFKPCD